MRVLSYLLIFLGCLLIGAGFFLVDGAPQQAAAAGFACFFGILARLAQSAAQHNDWIDIYNNHVNKNP